MNRHVRIRHGVVAAVAGYRAVREVDGQRTWLGPWRVLEADADADVEKARAQLRAIAGEFGIPLSDRSNPDTGL